MAGYRPEPGGWYASGYVTAPADQPTSGYETAGDNRSNAPRPPNYGNVHVLAGSGQSDTYIEISNRGRQSFALLDTGCEQSVCPLRLCRNAKLKPVRTELYAANDTPIPVVGVTRVHFKIQDVPMYADVYVTESVEDLILGYDFLERNKCEWLFGQSRIVINDMTVPLRSRPAKSTVRRIYVREPITIPPDSSANVSVRMPFLNLNAPNSDWVTDPKEIRPGLLAARTLLSNDDTYAAIWVMNVSGVGQSFRKGHALGTAASCPLDEICQFPDSESGSQPNSQRNSPSADSAANDLTLNDDNYNNRVDTNFGNETAVTIKCATVHIAAPAEGADENDFAHVQPVIDRLPATLTDDQREQAVELIKRNADIFSRHEFDVGCTNLLTADIPTYDHPPIAEPLRRHARVHLDTIDETIDRMETAGIVEKANSPWSANLVVITRKDENGKPTTPRITIDFRGLNAITCRDRFPLPNLKECLHTLDKACVISTIDISNSFFQLLIKEEDRNKTSFLTRKGQFRFTRLPQGCTNSPAVFCRLMGMVLKGLTCCLAYIDDTICFSPSFDAHLTDLQTVFDRFRLANLKLKATKCKLFQERCKFLGYIVSAKGLETDESKVACITGWPFPKSISELRGFLGLCSYYRSFCPGFATIADPLTECLRKGVKLCNTPRRQEAFDRLKQMLTSAPVLAVPRDDPECTWVMDSDASLTGASCVLQQWQDGKLRVVEYASRSFNKAERQYCATRRELASLIFGLKQFRQYLLGRQFEIRVDNMALYYLKRTKDPQGQFARYLDFLSDFTFDTEYRSSARHTNVDAISRLRPCEVDGGEPCRQCNKRINGQHRVGAVQTRRQSRLNRRRQTDSGDETAGGNMAAGGDETATVNSGAPPTNTPPTGADQAERRDTNDTDNQPRVSGRGHKHRRRRKSRTSLTQTTAPTALQTNWTAAEIRDMQLHDDDIGPAIAWLEGGVRPPWPEVQGRSPMLRSLWQQFDSLVLREGVIYRSFYDQQGNLGWYQLILPNEMKVPFLELIHNDAAGHLKFAKCVPHVMRRSWWLNWKTDLKLFIKCCPKCESFHRGQPPRQANLQPMLVGAPGERWHIDLCGPFPPSNGYKYLFTAICAFSKFGVCVPIRNKEAQTVAKTIVDHIFLTWGLCHEIVTDLGQEFQAELLSELLKLLDVRQLKSSGYRAQTNGCCEVWHRTLNSLLAKVVAENQRDWSTWVPYVTFCYNATTHSSTQFPPFFVYTGRLPLWTVDLILPDNSDSRQTLPEYTMKVVERLDKVNALVREHLQAAAVTASRWYNKKARPRTFQPGDKVRIFYPRRVTGRTPKWQSFYRTEGEVVKKINDATYLVNSKSWRENKIIHTDKLRPITTFE